MANRPNQTAKLVARPSLVAAVAPPAALPPWFATVTLRCREATAPATAPVHTTPPISSHTAAAIHALARPRCCPAILGGGWVCSVMMREPFPRMVREAFISGRS